MPHSKKSQYTQINNRVIYLLLNPLTKEFFISHCQEDLIIDIFKHHYYGKRYPTKECIEDLKSEDLHPCLFILERLHSTKVDAYNYVIAWTKIFHEAGYTNLNQGNILDYIDNLHENNMLIFNERKVKELGSILKCDACLVSHYGRKMCPLYKGDTVENK